MSNAAVHLKLIAPLTGLAAIAQENVAYTPAKETPWLRPTFAPNRTVQAALGDTGANRYNGVFLVDVFSPIGVGFKAADDLAETVMAAYARGTILGSTVVVERSYRSRGRVEDDWYHVPVTVEYRADIAP